MNIRLVNNTELVIKARTEKDYHLAQLVAEKLCSDHQMVIASVDDYTFTVHVLNFTWQGEIKAADIKQYYKEAKSFVAKTYGKPS